VHDVGIKRIEKENIKKNEILTNFKNFVCYAYESLIRNTRI